MTSEPSSTTIASKPSTSTSEIQTDTSEPFQLEVLALKLFLKSRDFNYPQQYSETQSLQYLPKSNPKIPILIVCCIGLQTPFPPSMS